MFRLFRYYSIASAVAIVAVTVALAAFYRDNAVGELITTAESQNVVLARTFANILWPRFSPYITSVSGEDGDALRARTESCRSPTGRPSTVSLPVPLSCSMI